MFINYLKIIFLILIFIKLIELNKIKTNPWSEDKIDKLNLFRLKKKETINENSTINKEWKEKSEQNKKRKKAIIKQQQLSVDWQLPTPETPKKLEEIQLINLHADINFLANQTVIHKRTPIYLLEYNECLEVYFRIEGKRTRLI